MNRQTLSRAAALAAQSTEWLVLVFLLAVSVPPIFIRHGSLKLVPALNLLDDSWMLDTTFKAAGGIWFGRDVAFTYGPLYQWLSSAPSRWIGLSTGAIYAASNVLLFFVIILATWLTARLLLPDVAPWRRGLLLLLAVVFWLPPDVRVALSLLAFGIFVRMTSAVTAIGRGVLLPAAGAALICSVLMLVSADTGLYGAAALLLCVLATVLTKRRPRQLAKFLAMAAVCFVLVVLLINAVMLSPLNFTFWQSSFAIAAGYRWFEPMSIAKADKHLILKALALAVAVFSVAWWVRSPSGRWTRRPAFLLAGSCMSILMMQTSLVRSDHGHVTVGLYTIIFFCGAIAIDESDSNHWLSCALPAIVVVATLLFAHPFPLFLPSHVRAEMRRLVAPVTTCPVGYQEFDRACLSPADAALLSSTSVYVDSHTAPGDPIAVFPYETAFGMTSRHQVAGGVLQSYLVNGEYLTRLELDSLRRANPPFALYLPDGTISFGVDSVPNFTRSPEVWFYFLRHYREEGSPVPGVLGLEHDEGRDARLTFSSTNIANRMGAFPIGRRNTTLDLGRPRWPLGGADFLRLRLRVDYPPWWRVRKPSQLTLQMSFEDGSDKSVQFLVQPNHASDVWIYPWDETSMGSYFLNDESQWRGENRPAMTGIKLLISPYDWMSVAPDSVSVDTIEAVQVSLRP